MKSKMDLSSRCEMSLMGKVVPVYDNSEVQEMTEYLLHAMGHRTNNLVDIMKNAINKYGENNVKYLVCNQVHGMNCVTFLLECGSSDPEESYPAPFEEDYGSGYPSAYCYVFNTENDWCSEFGDCFFEKKADGYYHRVS